MSDLEKVKELRERTGAGVVDARNALNEAKDNIDRAIEILNERGLVRAAKKINNATGSAILESYIHNNRVGVLLQMSVQTDFAAKSDPIKNLAHDLAMQIASMDPINVKTLLSQPFVKDPKVTVADIIKQIVAKVGENITVDKFCRYET